MSVTFVLYLIKCKFAYFPVSFVKFSVSGFLSRSPASQLSDRSNNDTRHLTPLHPLVIILTMITFQSKIKCHRNRQHLYQQSSCCHHLPHLPWDTFSTILEHIFTSLSGKGTLRCLELSIVFFVHEFNMYNYSWTA